MNPRALAKCPHGVHDESPVQSPLFRNLNSFISELVVLQAVLLSLLIIVSLALGILLQKTMFNGE